MAAPAFLRSDVSDLIGSAALPVLEELFRSSYKEKPMKRDMIAKTVPTVTSIWQYSELHDMPQHSAVSEGADYTFNDMKQGYDKTLTVVKYGLGFSISEEAVDDGKWGFIEDAVKKMGKSARHSQELAVFNLLNNAFGSTVTADGLSLCNAAHTTPTGTYTIRNQLAVAADLSVTALETAIADYKKNFVGDTGIPMEIDLSMLCVPEELRLYAKQLVGSELKPDTNNNNKNVLADEGLSVLASEKLTDADAWFLIAPKDQNGLRIVSRKPVETKYADEAVGFVNDAIYIKSRFREVVGAVHPLGIFGTPGA